MENGRQSFLRSKLGALAEFSTPLEFGIIRVRNKHSKNPIVSYIRADRFN